MEALQALSNEIGQPGAEKLYRAVERRNLPYNRKQVADFVRAQSTRQVFQKRPKYEGKITAVSSVFATEGWSYGYDDLHRLTVATNTSDGSCTLRMT